MILEYLYRVEKFQINNSKLVHYLEDKIQNVLIVLIAENIKPKIIDMLKEPKYFSLIY